MLQRPLGPVTPGFKVRIVRQLRHSSNMGVSKDQEPQYRPPNSRALNIRTHTHKKALQFVETDI